VEPMLGDALRTTGYEWEVKIYGLIISNIMCTSIREHYGIGGGCIKSRCQYGLVFEGFRVDITWLLYLGLLVSIYCYRMW